MGIFSDELKILDDNTVQYMIDDMQDTITEQQKQITEKDKMISEKDNLISEKDKMLQLCRLLAELGRTEDLLKMQTDEVYRKALYGEFDL